tara:strand:+ start:13227 stop:14111 length:885 start_codon:yes stop_codon:yes gene_type:complete
MFNEFEDDGDDDEFIFLNIKPFEYDPTEDQTTSPNMYPSEAVLSDPEVRDSVMNHVDEMIEYSRQFKSDKIFYDISFDIEGNHDTEGYLLDQFKISTKSISEVVNGRAAFDPDTYINGNIAIYMDTIEDSVTAGGEIGTGEFKIFSPCGKHGNPQPAISLVYDTGRSRMDDGVTPNPFYGGAIDFSDSETWGFEVRTGVGYSSNEKLGFRTKYGAISGVDQASPDLATQNYLNNIFDTAALDVYNTVITREFVPKIIKQERNVISKLLKTSIGAEADPMSATSFNTTTTYDEES